MLDAAHGERVRTVCGVERFDVARPESQVGRVEMTCSIGRGARVGTPRADVRQGARRVAAVARSKHLLQSLE